MLSCGITIQMLISEMHNIYTSGNIVFPLFGATDKEKDYYLSNELARNFVDKINANETIAVACGNGKIDAITGGLRMQIIDTLITDEYTTKEILLKAN